jgi:ligand-binding SRPBCC domain-containing protein
MTNLNFETRMPCSLQKLWEFHSSSEALHSLSPPLTKVKLKGELQVINGAKLEVRSTILGIINQDWEVELLSVNPPNGFTDRAIKSPFIEWEHNHLFRADGETSILRDELFFTAPGGPLGRLASILIITVLFKFRHLRTKSLLNQSFEKA